MARPLAGRVDHLERAKNPACPACGGGGPGLVTFRVVLPEPVRRLPDAPEPGGNLSCPRCGRITEFRVAMPPARG